MTNDSKQTPANAPTPPHSDTKDNREIDDAVRRTAEYLYSIKGDVTDEEAKTIGMLRQLINEVFKPEKQLSSQFLYDQIHPLLQSHTSHLLDTLLEAMNNLSKYYFDDGDPYISLDQITTIIKEMRNE